MMRRCRGVTAQQVPRVPERWILAFAIAAVIGAAAPAHAYEFAMRARVIGQAYELRSFRLIGSERVFGRRRFVQTLALDIWDIGDRARERRRRGLAPRGPTVSFTGYLRLDHDFGDWTLGTLDLDGDRVDALDAIPELASSTLALDLLYGYFSVDDIGGMIDVQVGRLLTFDALDVWSMDGVTVRARLPGRVAVEAFGGLRVRDASPLGTASVELDGTGGAGCREYVEGATPGTGSWKLIDRSRVVTNRALSSDFEYCPQRLEWMPTFGAAIETWGWRDLHARVVYRRSQSPSVGLIGDVDRLDHPDLGYYPNDFGQAPGWGVNEERIAGEVRGRISLGRGRGEVAPWAAARWSLLHHLADEAAAGVRLRWGDHAVEPEVRYTFPTFDGDSIWNVFAIAPTSDVRLTWDLAPRGGRLRAFTTAWLRWYHGWSDGGEEVPAARAAGVVGAVELAATEAITVRVDGLHDDGYGGRRSGGAAAARWRGERLAASARLSVLDVVSDGDLPADALTGAVQGGLTWRLADGVAVHVTTELTSHCDQPLELRAFGVLDFAFVPEM